jgi:ABC-2 type transport system permease protein
VPLLAPLLFALVVVPALADTFGTAVAGVDYMTFVAVATIGLLVPLSCMQSGLGVVVDRLGGGLRDLLAAPVSRPMIVAGNLVVALILASLQVAVLLGAAALRGAEFDLHVTGVIWFAAATLGFAVAMYGAAEILANRLPTQEEYIGALPAVAIVPFFFAGSFFPISALPAGLTVIGKLLPITHTLALVRYGLAGDGGAGLRDIWGMRDATAMAGLSLGVVAVSAVALSAAAVRTFRRTAVR